MKKINDINLKELIENETGEKFDKSNKMRCPFHNEKTPSFSINFNSNKNKWIWKCFGSCDESGDAIDFIMLYRHIDFKDAKEYLGLTDGRSDSIREKIQSYIEWQISKCENRKGQKLIGLFPFTDESNNVIYMKAKFLKVDNSKDISYYHVDDQGKVVNARGYSELPYNYYNLLIAIRRDKAIFIVEGEKDVNTLKSLGYVATSFKGFSKKSLFSFECFRGCKVIFCGDTGLAGKKYLEQVKAYLFDIVKEFNILELNKLELLGDNADITDWLEGGHSDEELVKAISNLHDLKKHEVFKYVTEKEKKGKKYYEPKNIWENLECVLKYNDVKLRYNKLSKIVECQGISNEYGQNAIYCDIHSLSVKAGLKMSGQLLDSSIDRIAKKYRYSPVQEYLLNCLNNWNEKGGNIKLLSNTIKTRDNFDLNIKELYLKKWLLNCVRIAFNDDKLYCCEGVLVFQGKQGIRKTTWLNKLSPDNNWIKSGLQLDTSKKDDIMKVTNYWIAELGELDATFRSDVRRLRSFITESKDLYRRPYDKCPEEYPRLTAFFGTVNELDFLKDEAGNRRYWVIPVEKILIDEFDKIDLDKLWGEVMYMWKNDIEVHYLKDEEMNLLNINNEKFEVKSEEYGIVSDKLNWNSENEKWIKYTPTELSESLGIKSARNLKSALNKFGIEQKKDKQGRYYLCPPLVKSK